MKPVGYGTFPLKETLERSIPEALACGYRLIDTSDNYHNEEFVGRGLAASDVPRDEVTVVTKFSSPYKTWKLSACFEQSERRLGGRIDVYLLHWPYPFLWKVQWRQMEELCLAGRCRAIGVCNFDRAHLEKLLRFCRVRPAFNQFERHPMFGQAETAAFCRKEGIRVMCYSPLARMDARLVEHPVLREIAARHGKSVGQIVLRWNVEHGDLPLPASGSPDHIRANGAVEDFRLSAEEVGRIDALEAGMRIRFDPDRRFTLKEKMRFLACRMKGALRHA